MFVSFYFILIDKVIFTVDKNNLICLIRAVLKIMINYVTSNLNKRH